MQATPHPPPAACRLPARCRPRGALTTVWACALLATDLGASNEPASLGDLSLEQLMDIPVITSVSKKAERLSDAAAAITVLSNEELRHSGFTSVAEALRWVPGMAVGAGNSSQWAISARGFNFTYANKLLVLVDGRTVYTPLFSGVYWDLQQTPLEDVDRIEVIRGPGATLWGANAVNGVINVVTRDAKDTQGGLFYGGGGNVHHVMTGARFGGRVDEHTYYRIYGGYQLKADYPLPNGAPANDGWQSGLGGFRFDRHPDEATHLTWQTEATLVDLDDHTSDGHNVHTLGRWRREISPESILDLQAYVDRTHRNETMRSRPTTHTVDLSAQHTVALGERNELVWGMGYRFINEHVEQTMPAATVRDGGLTLQLFNAFLQNEFKVVPDRWSLTAGVKLEHNDFTGFEVQPSVRSVFKPTERQTVWAAVSRAIRTPSEVEGRDVFAIAIGAPFVGPGGALFAPTLFGNPSLRTEEMWAYELGYRVQPHRRISLDVAAFYNVYRDIINVPTTVVSAFIPGVPVGTAQVNWANLFDGEAYGGEASVTYAATDQWRLTSAYSLLYLQLHGSPGLDPRDLERGSPRQQVALRSAYEFSKQVTFDAQLRYVDAIMSVPAYLTADLRLAYRPSERLEIALVGQNLFDNQHPEQGVIPLVVTSEVPRGFYGKLTWRF